MFRNTRAKTRQSGLEKRKFAVKGQSKSKVCVFRLQPFDFLLDKSLCLFKINKHMYNIYQVYLEEIEFIYLQDF
ncbi:hypothetical protein QTP88_005272 [Uroleucon formosanum]